jgi:hypothetical protein
MSEDATLIEQFDADTHEPSYALADWKSIIKMANRASLSWSIVSAVPTHLKPYVRASRLGMDSNFRAEIA